jgi:hypothetical protein
MKEQASQQFRWPACHRRHPDQAQDYDRAPVDAATEYAAWQSLRDAGTPLRWATYRGSGGELRICKYRDSTRRRIVPE